MCNSRHTTLDKNSQSVAHECDPTAHHEGGIHLCGDSMCNETWTDFVKKEVKTVKEPKTFDEAVEIIASEFTKLVIDKHHDYGTENVDLLRQVGVVMRIQEKAARLRNITEKGISPNFEAIDDSLNDIIGYAVVMVLLRRGWFHLPSKPENPPKFGIPETKIQDVIG